jgi:hypothetical protein
VGLFLVMGMVVALSLTGLYAPLFDPVYRVIARVINVLVGIPA